MRTTIMTIAGIAIGAVALSGCLPSDPPEGVLACTSSTECPSGWSCTAARCWRSGHDAGVTLDAGSERDAQVPLDAGNERDAHVQLDAGNERDAHVQLDAGNERDAHVQLDAGPSDAAPPDAPPTNDAGPGQCDPLDAKACSGDTRCAWVQLTEGGGETRCAPNGTVAAGGECSRGEMGETGFDDCQRGLVCVQDEVVGPLPDRASAGVVRKCVEICDLDDATSCGVGGACVQYAGLLMRDGAAIAGACRPRCDPLNRAGVAACPPGQGCYGLTYANGVGFVCLPAGTLPIGDRYGSGLEPIASSCAPGGTLLSGDPQRYLFCAAYCLPVETHVNATSGAAGMGPYSCPERGGASTDSCRFQWMFSASSTDRHQWSPSRTESYDASLNEIGLCVPQDNRYDHDDDLQTPSVVLPSCTTLPNTDTDGDGIPQHAQFGCAPRPRP